MFITNTAVPNTFLQFWSFSSRASDFTLQLSVHVVASLFSDFVDVPINVLLANILVAIILTGFIVLLIYWDEAFMYLKMIIITICNFELCQQFFTYFMILMLLELAESHLVQVNCFLRQLEQSNTLTPRSID